MRTTAGATRVLESKLTFDRGGPFEDTATLFSDSTVAFHDCIAKLVILVPRRDTSCPEMMSTAQGMVVKSSITESAELLGKKAAAYLAAAVNKHKNKRPR